MEHSIKGIVPRQISGRVCLQLEQIEQGDGLLDPKQEDQGEETMKLSVGIYKLWFRERSATLLVSLGK